VVVDGADRLREDAPVLVSSPHPGNVDAAAGK
jgi:hypothetical protein